MKDNLVNDCISRQAAIDAVDGVDWYHLNQHGEMVHGANDDEHQAWYKAEDIFKAIKSVPSAQPGWIPCSKKLPEMRDAGILKKLGIKQRSKRVYITIEGKRNDGSVERITDAEAELRDGEWYSDTLRWLKASGKKIEVTAWMPYPEPYSPEGGQDG